MVTPSIVGASLFTIHPPNDAIEISYFAGWSVCC